jgi:hypothetical protein
VIGTTTVAATYCTAIDATILTRGGVSNVCTPQYLLEATLYARSAVNGNYAIGDNELLLEKFSLFTRMDHI